MHYFVPVVCGVALAATAGIAVDGWQPDDGASRTVTKAGSTLRESDIAGPPRVIYFLAASEADAARFDSMRSQELTHAGNFVPQNESAYFLVVDHPAKEKATAQMLADARLEVMAVGGSLDVVDLRGR